MFFPGAAVYMEKIAVGADAVDAIDINATPTENVNAVAKAKGVESTDIRVVVLERDRHEELIGELRQAGARVNLIRDGDVAPAIAAARPETGVDLLYGIGGTPEGVISAAALKCVGGGIQGKLWPRNDEERQRARRRRLRPRPRAHDRRPRRERRRVRRGDRRHDRRAPARRSLRPRRRDHRFDRHALALRHRAPDRGAPQPQQADAVHREGVLMSEIGPERARLRRAALHPRVRPSRVVREDGRRRSTRQGRRREAADLGGLPARRRARVRRRSPRASSSTTSTARTSRARRRPAATSSRCRSRSRGQNEFDFEYGDAFGEKIEEFDPDFSKVLVRYNPEGDAAMNERQTAKLAPPLASGCTSTTGSSCSSCSCPAEPAQLERVGGSDGALRRRAPARS